MKTMCLISIFRAEQSTNYITNPISLANLISCICRSCCDCSRICLRRYTPSSCRRGGVSTKCPTKSGCCDCPTKGGGVVGAVDLKWPHTVNFRPSITISNSRQEIHNATILVNHTSTRIAITKVQSWCIPSNDYFVRITSYYTRCINSRRTHCSTTLICCRPSRVLVQSWDLGRLEGC